MRVMKSYDDEYEKDIKRSDDMRRDRGHEVFPTLSGGVIEILKLGGSNNANHWSF